MCPSVFVRGSGRWRGTAMTWEAERGRRRTDRSGSTTTAAAHPAVPHRLKRRPRPRGKGPARHDRLHHPHPHHGRTIDRCDLFSDSPPSPALPRDAAMTTSRPPSPTPALRPQAPCLPHRKFAPSTLAIAASNQLPYNAWENLPLMLYFLCSRPDTRFERTS